MLVAVDRMPLEPVTDFGKTGDVKRKMTRGVNALHRRCIYSVYLRAIVSLRAFALDYYKKVSSDDANHQVLKQTCWKGSSLRSPAGPFP